MCRTTALILSLLIVFCCFNGIVEGDRDEEIANLLRFNFFPSPTIQQTFTTTNLDTILANPLFQRNRKTIFYFHGFTQVITNPGVQSIRDAYIENGNYNVILMSIDPLLYTSANGPFIADNAAQGILRLINAGYNAVNTEIVGFSLGANIAGTTGRRLADRSAGRNRISRIVGIDTSPANNDLVLRTSDALFVTTIHTETRAFGSSNIMGHASFWVNGAVIQPMCPPGLLQSVCSHEQAQHFWAEAVRSNEPKIFPARLCNTFNNFSANLCSNNPINVMNPETNTAIHGMFFLNTNLVRPYARYTADP